MSEQSEALQIAEEKFFIASTEGWWDYLALTCSESAICSENTYPQASLGEGGN